MGLNDIKTDLEKAAGPVDDKAKEMFDQAKDKMGNMADDADDKMHSKGGEIRGRADQMRSDYNAMDDDKQGDDLNHADPNDPGYTGVDEGELGAPGRKTTTGDLNMDDNPIDDEDRSLDE